MQIIKDRFLILGVAVLVAIDLTILVTYTLIEGIRGNLVVQEVVHKEKPVNIGKVLRLLISQFLEFPLIKLLCSNSMHHIRQAR